MKIALFTDTFIPQVNGVANTVYRTAKVLSNLGHTVCVYTISNQSQQSLNKLTGGKIKVIRLPSLSAFVYKGERVSFPIGLAMRTLKKFKPDIIHSHTPFSVGWEAVIYAKRFKIPLVATHHTFFDHYVKYIHLDYDWARKISWKYTVGYYNRSNLVISPTLSLAEGLRINGLSKEIEIIPNPINTELFRPSSEKKSGVKQLVYMGRVSYEKSIDQVIKAVALVAKSIPDIRLLIVGDGPEKDNLKNLAEKLNIEKNIDFSGFIYGNELIKSLQASKLFLSGSKSENMPLAVLEAMSVGLPIIAVSSLGMKEVVQDKENGFLLSPDNFKQMAHKIIELLGDEAKLESFSQKSRELSFKYSEEQHGKNLVSIYEKLV